MNDCVSEYLCLPCSGFLFVQHQEPEGYTAFEWHPFYPLLRWWNPLSWFAPPEWRKVVAKHWSFPGRVCWSPTVKV